jgi:F420-0:gamma-glutamyl ligase-like protein
MLKTTVLQKYFTSVAIITPTIFKSIQVLTISFILIRLIPRTIAFGDVATGSINARDADSVAGIYYYL